VLRVLPMSGPGPQDERGRHINEEAPMTTSLFINPEIVNAEVDARRERLTRDWQQHPRGAGAAHLLRLGLHLRVHVPRRAHRHA
jgi:hypothetical protein